LSNALHRESLPARRWRVTYQHPNAPCPSPSLLLPPRLLQQSASQPLNRIAALRCLPCRNHLRRSALRPHHHRGWSWTISRICLSTGLLEESGGAWSGWSRGGNIAGVPVPSAPRHLPAPAAAAALARRNWPLAHPPRPTSSPQHQSVGSPTRIGIEPRVLHSPRQRSRARATAEPPG